MNRSSDIAAYFTRRTLLQFAPLSILELAGTGLASESSKARRSKSLILLYMTGGPAQQETFDPKPDAPEETRGEFKPIATSVPGIQICEHLPLLAKQAHRFAIIRSTWHGSNTHGVGVHYNLTGLKHAPREAGEPQVDRRALHGLRRAVHAGRSQRAARRDSASAAGRRSEQRLLGRAARRLPRAAIRSALHLR